MNKHDAHLTQPMHILVTIDQHYLAPLLVMLRSWVNTHPGTSMDLYVAHSALPEMAFDDIRTAVEDADVTVHDIQIEARWFSDTPVLERLPEESFYRLMAFHFLPETVDRCLYLDPDIIIRKSLTPLYEMPLDGVYLAAASHLHGHLNRLNKHRLGLKNQERYVNSGIMLMNLDEIRADFTLERVLDQMTTHIQKLIMGDQDLVNILFGARTVLIPEAIYNLDEKAYKYHAEHHGWTLADVEKKTAIIHYNGKYKPWNEGYEGTLDTFYPQVKDKGPAPDAVTKQTFWSALRIMKLTPQQSIVVGGAIFFALICIFSYVFFGRELLQIVSEPELFRTWLDGFGAFDELVFILIRAAQTVVKFIPAEPLEIGSGFAWGAIPGMLYCVIGNMIGTIAIFGLTKRYGTRILDLFVPSKDIKLLRVIRESDNIYILLFFLYVIPGLPKDGFTYFVGLLPVKLVPFLAITFIARMPSVLSSTLMGSSLAAREYWLAVVIMVLTIVLSAAGGFAYNRYVKRKSQV